MKTSTVNLPETAAVEFRNNRITTLKKDGVEYVALRPVAEAIGLDWESQYKLIQRDEVLRQVISIMEMTCKGIDGKDYKVPTLCLPLKYLNGWLFKINASRYNNQEQRERIIQYQLECYDALYNYWHRGVAINPAKAVMPGSLDDVLAQFSVPAGEARWADSRLYVSSVAIAAVMNVEAPVMGGLVVKYLNSGAVEQYMTDDDDFCWLPKQEALFLAAKASHLPEAGGGTAGISRFADFLDAVEKWALKFIEPVRRLEEQVRKLESEKDSLKNRIFRFSPLWNNLGRYKTMGLTMAEIVKLVGLHERTVRRHLKNMRECGLLSSATAAPALPSGGQLMLWA